MQHFLTQPILEQLIEVHGTPLYAYSLDRLRQRIGEIRTALGSAMSRPGTLLFATMANDRPDILKTMAEEGVGGCVNSFRHLNAAIRSGIPIERIQFTSTGITQNDMRSLSALGVRVNLDSPEQVIQFAGLRARSKAGLRVNIGSLMRLPAGSGDRIGMEVADVFRSVEWARQHGHHIDGLHIYMGTNYQRPDEMLPMMTAVCELASKIERLEYVNLGGGIGVDYAHSGEGFDLEHWATGLGRIANQFPSITFYVEPGRALVADCCVFVSQVTDIKQICGHQFVALDSSVSQFPRPLHHPESPHRVRLLRNRDSAEFVFATLVGRTTFSRDILAKCHIPVDTRIGDYFLFDDAGAYCESMSSRFLGQAEPSVGFADKSMRSSVAATIA